LLPLSDPGLGQLLQFRHRDDHGSPM
jgi:hypothetical protein